jgi:hypothetical protein
VADDDVECSQDFHAIDAANLRFRLRNSHQVFEVMDQRECRDEFGLAVLSISSEDVDESANKCDENQRKNCEPTKGELDERLKWIQWKLTW